MFKALFLILLFFLIGWIIAVLIKRSQGDDTSTASGDAGSAPNYARQDSGSATVAEVGTPSDVAPSSEAASEPEEAPSSASDPEPEPDPEPEAEPASEPVMAASMAEPEEDEDAGGDDGDADDASGSTDSIERLTEAREGGADDLKEIKGIGKKNEEKLNAFGIYHFDQIAAWTDAQAEAIGVELAFPGRIEREDWIGQAKILAAGGDTEFSKRVAKGEVQSSKG